MWMMMLRCCAHEAFAEKLYETATRLYSRALACRNVAESDRIACLGNRAEASLRLERWEAASEDARAILELDPSHTKAKFRLASALLKSGSLPEAFELETAMGEHAKPKEKGAFEKLLHEIQKSCDEAEQGKYNLSLMRKEIKTDGRTAFHASFTSSMIERGVTISKCSGFTCRGTRATGAISRETLISASKAFVYVPPLHEQNARNFGVNPYTNYGAFASRLELESEVVVKLHRRPGLRKTFYSLSSGLQSELLINQDQDARIDLDRIQRTISINVFATYSDNLDLEAAYAKIERPNPGAMSPPKDLGSGLWINESCFNHSCIPNCAWSQIGDHIFIRTTRDIEAGEELCVSYVDCECSFAEREQTFSRWGRI